MELSPLKPGEPIPGQQRPGQQTPGKQKTTTDPNK